MSTKSPAERASQALEHLQPVLARLRTLEEISQACDTNLSLFPLRSVVLERIARYNHLRQQKTDWPEPSWASVHNSFANYCMDLRMEGKRYLLKHLSRFAADIHKTLQALYRAACKKDSLADWVQSIQESLNTIRQIGENLESGRLADTDLNTIAQTIVPFVSNALAAVKATRQRPQQAHAPGLTIIKSQLQTALEAVATNLDYIRFNSSATPLDDLTARLAHAHEGQQSAHDSMRREPGEPSSCLAEFQAQLEQARLLREDTYKIKIRVERGLGVIDGLLRWRRADFDALAALAKLPSAKEDIGNHLVEIDTRLQRFEAFAARDPRVPWPDPVAASQAIMNLQARIKSLNNLLTLRTQKPGALERYRKQSFESIDAVLQSLPT